MLWSDLTFGKYKGKSLPQVILHDPDYFFWGCEKGIFDRDGFLEQAYVLEGRACNIKIPKPNPQEWRVLYYTDGNGRFAGFEIVNHAEDSANPDSIEMWREDSLDLSVARRFKSYDKLGGKILIKTFKRYFFGSKNIRITKQRCEEFFSNANNFVRTPGQSGRRSGWPFIDHKEPNTWAKLVAENSERIRREAELENHLLETVTEVIAD